jgi:hypothetical protein
MAVSDLFAWDSSRFKHELKSRVDDAMERINADALQARKWDAEIDARDGKRCRACGKASHPQRIGLTTRGHRHHIVYASACGGMEPSNRVTLCARCHSDEHHDRLRFRADGGPYAGIDANEPMEFWRKEKDDEDDDVWYLSRRELAVGVPEKD